MLVVFLPWENINILSGPLQWHQNMCIAKRAHSCLFLGSVDKAEKQHEKLVFNYFA